jgi:hypothetical protein
MSVYHSNEPQGPPGPQQQDATPQGTPQGQMAHERRVSAEALGAGAMAETLVGIAALTLAIIGLAGIYPLYLAPITVIALGGALMMQGSAVAARYTRLLRETGGDAFGEAEIGTSMTAEFVAGSAGLVLGILGLIGLYPVELTAVAVIVYGGGLVVGSGLPARLTQFQIIPGGEHALARQIASEAMIVASGARLLVGAAAIALGILALSGVLPMMLTLVALLSLGGGSILSGSAITGRMFGALSR